jgi:hypothetical protein
MKKALLTVAMLAMVQSCFCWGFFAHRTINYYAVFLLPPEMIPFYKKNIGFLADHAVDPDKRRYILPEEAPRHFMDLDHYGPPPYDRLPRSWKQAQALYPADSLARHGIAPWWLPQVVSRLTAAFRSRDADRILKVSAELGHYMADIHVPLHASSNHNGQLTGQQGIHGFWESRLPELFAARDYDFLIGHAGYLNSVSAFAWDRITESALAADTVLRIERELSAATRPERRFAFEDRNGKVVRQYAEHYAADYQDRLRGMVERRMLQSILAVASCWYTAWVDAGQPALPEGPAHHTDPADSLADRRMDSLWKAVPAKGRTCAN